MPGFPSNGFIFDRNWQDENKPIETKDKNSSAISVSNLKVVPSAMFNKKTERIKALQKEYKPRSQFGAMAFVLLKDSSDYEHYGFTNNLPHDCNLTAEDYSQISALNLGDGLIKLNLVEEHFVKIAHEVASWLFFDNESAQLNHHKQLKEYAESYYTKVRSADLNSLEKLLAAILGAIGDLFFEILADLLAFISKQLRALKIEDPDLWRPYNADGSLNVMYSPIFFIKKGDIMRLLNSLENQVAKIDEMFQGWLKTSNLNGNYTQIKDPKQLDNIVNVISYFYSKIKEIISELYKEFKKILDLFLSYLEHLNAFMVGLYNGLLEMAAGLFDLIALAVDGDKRKELLDSISAVIDKIKAEGFFKVLEEILKEYLSKYNTATSSYDILKFLGEDLAEAIFTVIIIVFTGGTAALSTAIKQPLKLIDNIATASKKSFNDVQDLVKSKKHIPEGSEPPKSPRKDFDEQNPKDPSKDEPRKDIDDEAKQKKLKLAQELWDNFTYDDAINPKPGKKLCIEGGTLVFTNLGLKRIEDIIEGDKLYSFNQESTLLELTTVVRTLRNWTDMFVDVLISTGEVLSFTENHVVWDNYDSKWKFASNLTRRSILKSPRMNKAIKISNITRRKVKEAPTYNIELDKVNNFMIGRTGIMVHNSNHPSIFESLELKDVYFYDLVEPGSTKSSYVGQTIRDPKLRETEHRNEGRKNSKNPKKSWKKNIRLELRTINGVTGPFKLTPLESHVIELYETSAARGENKGVTRNLKKQISEAKFNEFKKKNTTMNPCKLYV